MSSGLAGSRNDCHTTGCHVRDELPALHVTVLVTPAVVAFALDPSERRELPGHERIAAVLDRRADLEADFRRPRRRARPGRPPGRPGPAGMTPGAAIVAPMKPLPDGLLVQRAEFEYSAVRKDPRVAYGLWCVAGIFGGHRFYLGDTGRSVAMLFTLGGLGVWTLLDGFFVGRRVRAVNRARRAAIMARYGIVDGDVTGSQRAV